MRTLGAALGATWLIATACSGKTANENVGAAGASAGPQVATTSPEGSTATGGGGKSAGGVTAASAGGSQSTGGVTAASAGGATSSGGTSAGGLPGSGAGGSTAACDALRTQAADALSADAGTASLSTACSSDDDCTWLPVSSCTYLCGSYSLVAKSELPKVNAAISASQALCDEFTAAGCKTIAPPCAPRGPGGPACIDGACTLFITEKWSKFIVTSKTSQNLYENVWNFTPDGYVQKIVGNEQPSTLALSAADFAELDDMLRSMDFRRAMWKSFNCTMSGPIDAPLRFSVTRVDADDSGNIGTGDLAPCLSADADGATGYVDRIWALAQRY